MPGGRRAQQPGADQPPPGIDKSQQLIDAVNALAWGINSLAESLPQFCETLEVVSQQFAVLIAAEAQRRSMTAEDLAHQMLVNLGQRVFRGRRGGG